MAPSRMQDPASARMEGQSDLAAENTELRARLEEAEDTLRALRAGEVDAIVIGSDLYTLESAEAASNRLRGEALAQMQDAVIAIDSGGRITFLNRAAETLYGQSSSSVLGHPLATLYTERAAAAGPGSSRKLGAPTVQRRADGTEFFVDATASPVRHDQQAAETIIVVRDVTERVRSEAAAEKREHFLERVIAVAPGILYVLDTVERRMVFVSAGAEKLIGYTSRQFAEMGRDALELLVHPDDLHSVLACLARMQRAQDGEVVSHEYRLRHANGNWRWFQGRDAVFARSEDGSVRQVIATAVDITDWRAAADEVARREREFSTLVENSPDVVARFDRDLRHTYVSPAIRRYTGRDPECYLGRTNAEMAFPLELCQRWDAALRNVFHSGQVGRIGFEVSTPAGELRYLDSRLMPEIGKDGRVESVLAVATDVTERERAEQALRNADRQKDRFLATLAHELRNPLAPISNALAILRSAPEPALGKQALDVMERQLLHMVRLVDDLLDVNRITHDKLQLRKNVLEISDVIRAAVETSRPQIDAGQHALAIALPDEPVRVDGDRARLIQVIGNLLNNAARYSPQRSRIEVRAASDAADAIVTVKDNGFGVRPESLDSIFEMFNQGDESQTGSHGGLGIGLALVKRLVELHGGSVRARSDGRGTGLEVEVRLPALNAAEREEMAAPDMPARDNAGIRPLKVLVADDSIDNAETLASLLEMMGCVTQTASDGSEAVRKASEWHPELLFLDLGMPTLDGLGAARRIRSHSWGGAMVLVAVTGWGQDEDRVRTSHAGFDHHLVKPVQVEALQQLVLSQMRKAPANPYVAESD